MARIKHEWSPKVDPETNLPIPNCWISQHNYTVAVCLTPERVFQVTAPKSSKPFAHLTDRNKVELLIKAHMESVSK